MRALYRFVVSGELESKYAAFVRRVYPAGKAGWLYWTSDFGSPVAERLPEDPGASINLGRYGSHSLIVRKDWVLRFNAHGPEGLADRQAPGHPGKLNTAQREALAAMVESGPMPAMHGVVRWRLKDLAMWVWEEFRVSVSETTLSRIEERDELVRLCDAARMIRLCAQSLLRQAFHPLTLPLTTGLGTIAVVISLIAVVISLGLSHPTFTDRADQIIFLVASLLAPSDQRGHFLLVCIRRSHPDGAWPGWNRNCSTIIGIRLVLRRCANSLVRRQ